MMDLIANIPLIGGTLAVLLPFILVLGVVVFIHEYGHYIVGRWCGIHAEVFSLGFGPILKSWDDRRGTKWQIAAIPLGGYVRFLGDADGSSRVDHAQMQTLSPDERDRSFHGAAIYKRALTVVAGPVANFLLSIVVFAALVTAGGIGTNAPVVGVLQPLPGQASGLETGDKILEINGVAVESYTDIFAAIADQPAVATMPYFVERDGRTLEINGPYPLPPLVSAVEPLSPASKAGLLAGDVVIEVADMPIVSFRELRDKIIASPEVAIPILVWRNGTELPLSITPKERDTEAAEGGFERRVMIGVLGGLAFEPVTYRPVPWEALWIGVKQTYSVIKLSLVGIYHMFAGDIGVENLQGPLGIAQISGDSAAHGIGNLVRLIAIISTAIGLLNLFPIPVLDGGHLLIFAYEAIRGRPPSEKFLQVIMTIGISLVLLLMVFATYNDILRL